MRPTSKTLLRVIVLTALAAGAYVVITKALEKKRIAEDSVSTIQAELDELDPITRAAVVAKLSSDQASSFGGAVRSSWASEGTVRRLGLTPCLSA